MVALEGVRLRNGSPPITLTLGDGRWALVGRAGAGKSRLLDVVVRGEAPEGVLERPSPVAEAGRIWRTRLATPQSIARAVFGRRREALAEAMSTLGLWTARNEPVIRLSDTMAAACELLPVLDPEAEFIAIDGQVDRLDPWTRDALLTLWENRRIDVWIATHDLALAERLGNVIALREGGIGYAGSVSDLLARHGPTRLQIESSHPDSATALVDPLTFEAEEDPEGVILSTLPGQEAAARLLTLGYGNVRAVMIRRPTLLEALRPWT